MRGLVGGKRGEGEWEGKRESLYPQNCIIHNKSILLKQERNEKSEMIQKLLKM